MNTEKNTKSVCAESRKGAAATSTRGEQQEGQEHLMVH